jgi:hypothetical protein
LFGPVLPTKLANSARRGLEWMGDAIGAVRDLDVMSALV